jgi:hypothetical protein
MPEFTHSPILYKLGASPQLEYWSDGMVGLKEFCLLKMVYSTLLPNIPHFQHSSIPNDWDFDLSPDNNIISTGCRIPETFN